MAFGGFHDDRHGTPMADINVTPMVDVMLVLLVIFILTAPLFTHAIKLDLPAAQSAPAPEQPHTITVSVDGEGKLYWNDAPLAASQLDASMAEAARQQPQPELQLRADKSTRYETIAQVMAAAQTHGLTRLGFVTQPKDATPAAAPAVKPAK